MHFPAYPKSIKLLSQNSNRAIDNLKIKLSSIFLVLLILSYFKKKNEFIKTAGYNKIKVKYVPTYYV